jgi:hypothetical protein
MSILLIFIGCLVLVGLAISGARLNRVINDIKDIKNVKHIPRKL